MKTSTVQMIQEIPINKIEVIENVRTSVTDKGIKDLMSSIKQHGLEQAIKVGSTKSGKFTLIYGQRRLTACRKLGWNTIRAEVVDEPDLKNLLIRNVTENLQRKDPTPAELGRMCVLLKKRFDMTDDELSVNLSTPRTTLNDAINIYNHIPKELQDKVTFMGKGGLNRNGAIPASVAIACLAIRKTHGLSEAVMTKIFDMSRTENLTRPDLEIIGYLIKNGVSPEKALTIKNKFNDHSVKFIVERDDLTKKAKAAKMNNGEYLRGIIYGEQKPLVRPDFIKK